MCGIAGVQSLTGAAPPSADALRAMTGALVHRGPDDAGHEVLGATALGFRRLAIVDLAGGHQPMGSACGARAADGRSPVWVVMNGEIYNHAALRDDLRARGHAFSTASDTEVLVHGWEEWGADLPRRLVGMFAFAVLDRRDGSLFLARDRFGQKPLYWAETPAGFLFASELKALRRHPAAPTRIDRRALRKYLAYEMVPWPLTILEGVRKLAPGATLTVREGRVAAHGRYHDLAYAPKHALSEDAAARELWARLVDAVGSQLMADVPLGVFLSGGIDSTAIVAAAREASPGARLATFSIGFEDPSFDESRWAEIAARHFGTEHHLRRFTAAQLRDTVAELPRLLDEPFADASLLPTFLLCRFARESVTVALGGDAGDELLAGYDTFAAHEWTRRYEALVPRAVERAVIAPLVRALPISRRNMALDFRLRQFLRGARRPFALKTWGWMAGFLEHELPSILTPEALEGGETAESLFSEAVALDAEVAGEHRVDRQAHQMLRTYLAEGILTKVDRASMAVSLEVRAPFLDHPLADWIGRLPADMKLRGRERKRLLRRALRGRIPDVLLDRPKKGFGIPLSAWLRGELRGWAEATLDGLERDLGDLVRADEARRLLREHVEGRADHRKKLWTLLCLAQWKAAA
jgi:asparagine synthase (glutamine-hydrolysing)